MKKQINLLSVFVLGGGILLSALFLSGCINGTSGNNSVSDFPLESIRITTPPTKTTYNVGDNFDSSGMVVTATYQDVKTQTLSISDLQIEGFDSITQGTKTIKVSYTEGNVTESAKFTVTVIDPSKTVAPEGFVLIKSGTDTEVSVSSPYYIAEAELTYSKWKEVYDWATHTERGENKYTFQNVGSGGDNDEVPVSRISWRDAVIWCNAASEKDKLNPVYVVSSSDKTPVRVAAAKDRFYVDGAVENAFVDETANGYRLPKAAEWQFAARGGKPSAPEWKYTWAGTDVEASLKEYAVYEGSYSYAKESVKSKKPNSADLYDMSGNVYEWVYDEVRVGTTNYKLRSVYGGDFNSEADKCHVYSGLDVDLSRNDGTLSNDNSRKAIEIGFRLVRSLILE